MTSGALVDIVAAMKRFQRRALGQAVAGALLATACGQVRFGGPGMGGPRPNTNMTAEDREKARKNLMRIMGEVYRPELEAGRKKLLEALAVTSGERVEQGASAGSGTPATTRIKRLKAPPRAVRVVPAMGGRIYTLEGAPTEASELAAQLKVASETNHMLEELARKRHLDVVLGVVAFRRQLGDLEDEDYERVRGELDMLRQVDVLSALALAHVAAYQAAVATRDGRALDALVAKAKKAAVAESAKATRADADAFVAVAAGSLRKLKAEYGGALRAAAGDEVYEARMRAGIDRMFDPFIAMAERDANGSDVVLDTRGASTPPSSGAPPQPAVPRAARDAAIASMLDTGSALFPALGVMVKGAQGAAALAKGDYKAAIDCAVSMIPAQGLARDALLTGAELVKARV